jgi:glutamyl-tRNA reductase
MDQVIQKSLSRFFLAGISYEKADSAIRGLYAVNENSYAAILEKAHAANIPELFILSTCNRTEIYGFAHDAGQLIGLLCDELKGDPELFRKLAYQYQGNDAVRHLYRVAAGLDSQILGDYEIISQVKSAARFAREHQSLGTFTERLINSVLQVSKQIKNETLLSAGTVSVAFAAVQFLKDIPDIKSKRILLLGTGKIGRNTCKNMMSYFGAGRITLINRTLESATAFAETHGLQYAPYDTLPEHLNEADIILVATNAAEPTVKKSHFTKDTPHIIIDLSVPRNVSEGVKSLPAVRVIDVDELSGVQDKTLASRREEIPKALAIIEEQMQDFLYWYQMRKHAVVLQAVKQKMEQIHLNEIKNQKIDAASGREKMDEVSSRIIQKMINVFAGKLRHANGQADNYLQVLSEIFEIPAKE